MSQTSIRSAHANRSVSRARIARDVSARYRTVAQEATRYRPRSRCVVFFTGSGRVGNYSARPGTRNPTGTAGRNVALKYQRQNANETNIIARLSVVYAAQDPRVD